MSRIDVLDHGFVELVDSMPAVHEDNPQYTVIDGNCLACLDLGWGPGDARIVQAARVSYNGHTQTKTLEQDKRLLKYLIKNNHSSPLEQVKFTFRVRLPIFVCRQWMRHRTFQFNEVSARYTEVKDEFYIPELGRMQAQSKDNKQASGEVLDKQDAAYCQLVIDDVYEQMHETYKGLIAKGLSRELARMVLPVGMYTEMFCSVDLRNLLHFITLRDHPHAQHEIQVYARALAELARAVAPYTFQVVEELKASP